LIRQLIAFDSQIKEHAWIEDSIFIEKALELEKVYKNHCNKNVL